MKLVEQKLASGETISFVCFSVEEEYAMAKWYMDVLCLPWIDTREEFHKFIRQTFYRKCRGRDFTLEQAERLCEYNERYSDLLPSFPHLKNNGNSIKAPLQHKDGTEFTLAERIEHIQWIISNAWKETWEQHPDIKSKTDYKIFPGEEPSDDYIAKQKRIETEFWDEVDSKQAEYNCDRQQAILAVQDYMPRSDVAFQISDPSNP